MYIYVYIFIYNIYKQNVLQNIHAQIQAHTNTQPICARNLCCVNVIISYSLKRKNSFYYTKYFVIIL